MRNKPNSLYMGSGTTFHTFKKKKYERKVIKERLLGADQLVENHCIK